MNKFIDEDIWGYASVHVEKSNMNIACIAYITQTSLPLKDGDVLICDASEAAIKQGKTSATILEAYLKRGVVLFSDSSLHAKMLLTDDYLFIGSANLSAHSLHLSEAGVMTADFEIMSSAQLFCTERMLEENRIDENRIGFLKTLEVESKALIQFAPKKKQIPKRTNYWLTELGAELPQTKIKRIEGIIQDELKKDGEDILQKINGLDWIYVYSTGILKGKLKKGDRLLRVEWIGKQQRVFSPQTILKIIPDGKCEIVIHSTLKSSSVTFARFKKGLQKLNLVSDEEIFYYQPFKESDGAKLLELFP